MWDIVNNCRGLFDFAQILYRVCTHDARSTTNVQGQGVKGQGHSASLRISIEKSLRFMNGYLTEFKLRANYPRTQRNACYMFKVIRPNIQTAITPPRTVPFRSNFIQSLTVAKRSTAYVQGQRSQVKVAGSQFKVTA